MNGSSKPRKRAIRLTVEAHAELLRALSARWQRDARGTRLTHETRAELMGVSVATAKKIFAGEGVDRATLALAFKNLGLEWSDARSGSSSEEGTLEDIDSDSEPTSRTDPPPTPEADRETDSSRFPHASPGSAPRPAWLPMLAAALLVLGSVVIATAAWQSGPGSRTTAPAPALDNSWIDEYDQRMAWATDCYNKSNYIGAQKNVDRAFALLDAHESSRGLIETFKLSGEIAAARGDLRVADERFRAGVEAQRLLRRPPWAPLHEALGAVETRLREFPRAKANLMLALEGYQGNREPIGIATASCNLGILALARGELDSADAWLARALKAMGDHPDPDVVADIRGIQAMVLLERGDAAAAHRLLSDCLAHWTKKEHPRWIALTEMRLGLAEEKQGRIDDAKARITHSRDAFSRVGDEARVTETAEHLRRLVARRS